MMPTAPKKKLILASASPRRKAILRRLGLDFEIRPAIIDESPMPGESASTYVRRLSVAKAQHRCEDDELVIAADTVVTIDDVLLGKPGSDDEAKLMLARLSDRSHTVFTGVALRSGGHTVAGAASTLVEMCALARDEIDWYVATGEPRDKAGAYAIQGLGSLFVERIEGNYLNVVGLPLPLVYRLCTRLGFDLRSPN